MDFIRSHKLIVATILIQLALLPLILLVVKQRQTTTTKASASTTLFFNPANSTSSPLIKSPGEKFSMDLMINPGSNAITSVKVQVDYDPTKVKVDTTNPWTQNFQTFPVLMTSTGPVVTENGSTGKFAVEVAVKPVISDAIKVESKVFTINFIAVSAIDQTQISLNKGVDSKGDPNTMVTSAASTDNGEENVWISSTAQPAYIKVAGAPTNSPVPTAAPTFTPTPTNRPTSTPTPTNRPTSTPTPTNRPTSTPTPTNRPITSTPTPTTIVNNATKLVFSNIKLHGIGRGGDNANSNSIGNLTPLRTTRTLTVDLENSAGTVVNTATGNITYSGGTTGVFTGTITLPNLNGLIEGEPYNVIIKTPFYVRTDTTGFIIFAPGNSYPITGAELIAGDTDEDGSLENDEDYALIVDCYSDLAEPKNCNANKLRAADINDDGKVNQKDYNLFLRELSKQRGD